MNNKTKQNPPRESKKQEFLESLQDMILQRGLVGAITDLISHMGPSKVWFYRHYGTAGKSKAKADLCQQELLLEVYNTTAKALNEKIAHISASAPLVKLHAAMEVLLECSINPRVGLTVVHMALVGRPDVSDPLHVDAQKYQTLILKALEALAQRSDLPSPEKVAQRLMVVLQGFQSSVGLMGKDAALSATKEMISGAIKPQQAQVEIPPAALPEDPILGIIERAIAPSFGNGEAGAKPATSRSHGEPKSNSGRNGR